MPHFEILLQYGLCLEEPNTLQGLKDCNPVSGHDHPLPSVCSLRLFLCCSLGSLEDKGVLSSIICTTVVFCICVQGLWGRREKERGFFFFLEERVFFLFFARLVQWQLLVLEKRMLPAEKLEKGAQDPSSLPTVLNPAKAPLGMLPFLDPTHPLPSKTVPVLWLDIVTNLQHTQCSIKCTSTSEVMPWSPGMWQLHTRGHGAGRRCLPAQEARARCLDSSTDLVFFHKYISKCLNELSKILE